MHSPTQIKTFNADGAIAPYRILMPGADDLSVAQSTAADDAHFCVSEHIGAADGDRIDVVTAGIAEVEYGGNITRGMELTSDADGKAVEATGAANAEIRTIGKAMKSGVAGDIGSVQIAPGKFYMPGA